MRTKKHISTQFDADLESIRKSVLQMGGLVEEQIERAVKALTSADHDLMEQVVDDDQQINGLEVSIDEFCSQVIARRQPAASDLRMIIMVIKIITDLERMGDEAAKIARMAQLIYADHHRMNRPRFTELRHVANIATEMLRKSLDAFARLDVEEAVKVARQDEQVDDEFRSIIRQLVTFMIRGDAEHRVFVSVVAFVPSVAKAPSIPAATMTQSTSSSIISFKIGNTL